MKGLSRYTLPDNENPDGLFTHYLHDENKPNSLSNNFVWYVCEDSQNRLWVCTDQNLCRLDKKREQFTRIVPVIKNDTIKIFKPKCIVENPKGIFWIATEGHGLLKYNEKTGEFLQYDDKSDLPSRNLFSVLPTNRVIYGQAAQKAF